MSDEVNYSTGIRVETDVANEWVHDHVYVHIDEVGEPGDYKGMIPHIYCYRSEIEQNDLMSVVNEFQRQYIFASGVIFPDVIEEFMPDLSVEELNAIEWVMVLGDDGEFTRADVEYIIEYFEEDGTDI